MNKGDCPNFEGCSAPLCSLDEDSLHCGIWYPDEEICRVRKFQSLPWIRKQRRIAKLRLSVDDGFFTVKMLTAIWTITKNLKGADPDDFDSEEKWLKQRLEKRVRVSQKRGNNKSGNKEMRGNSIAKKKNNLVFATNTSNQEIGGEL